MRDYVMHRAEMLGETSGTGFLSRLYRNWRARGSVSKLADYDDYVLRDIGVTREEILWAASLPLTVNAALALEERAFRRRKSAKAS